MVEDSSRTPGVIGDLMPELTADLARLVAIPSVSSPGYSEPDARLREAEERSAATA